jgi:hypothetical protein
VSQIGEKSPKPIVSQIGEKSPKPIGKGTQIQKIKIDNLSSIIDANRTIYRFAY